MLRYQVSVENQKGAETQTAQENLRVALDELKSAKKEVMRLEEISTLRETQFMSLKNTKNNSIDRAEALENSHSETVQLLSQMRHTIEMVGKSSYELGRERVAHTTKFEQWSKIHNIDVYRQFETVFERVRHKNRKHI